MVNFAVFLQKYLCAGLMVAKANLVELDLSDNAFGPNGMNGLTDFLRSSSCYSLRELRLNNNGLGIHGGKVGHHFWSVTVLFVSADDVLVVCFLHCPIRKAFLKCQPLLSLHSE